MTDKIPFSLAIPGGALVDKSLPDAHFRLLSLVSARSGRGGCLDTNAALAGLLTVSVATLRKQIKDLKDLGWIMEEEGGKKRVLKVCFDRLIMEDPNKLTEKDINKNIDVFDKSGAQVEEKAINHVIGQWIKQKINPDVCRNEKLIQSFYANTHNRVAARDLIIEFGTVEIDKVLEEYGKHCTEHFCPKSRSLLDTYKKWGRITDYLFGEKNKSVTVVE